MRYTFSEGDRDSISARLAELYTIPARIFQVPVPDGFINVKIRLLSDQENLDVAKLADNYGPIARIIVQRRHILARAVIAIEGDFIEMPSELKQSVSDRTGRDPTDIDQKLWALEQCQSVLVHALMDCYEELLQEQTLQITELKKKFVESQVEKSPETLS